MEVGHEGLKTPQRKRGNVMTTYAELAAELGFGEDFEAFRTWANEHNARPDAEVPGLLAGTLRVAMSAQPEGPTGTTAENRNEDAVIDELARLTDEAGYDDELGSQI